MSDASNPISIFCSYAHKDEAWRQKLEAHLSGLKRQSLISTWHDRQILPGTDWAQDIDAHLNSASLILLLISSDFLASDYCSGIEMQRALEREQAKEARVIPIILRPVDWQGSPFTHLQMLPTDARPISTWPNEDEAFVNVVAGIRRAIEDLSLLPASVQRALLPLIWNIPYPRNMLFTGREDLLNQLAIALHAGQPTALSQPQAISGLGGIGKTQIAIEYAYRSRQRYQTVLWAQAETREALTTSFLTIATLLNLPEQNSPESVRTITAIKDWLHTHTDWLLILDNADNLTLAREFLPPTLGGHVLLTTRAQAMGRFAHRLEVEVLPPEPGILFLMRRSGLLAADAPLAQATPRERETARAIYDELGGLPLALDQAAAYIEETACSLSDYLSLFQRRRADLLAERRGLIDDHPHPVASTWSLSFQHVEQKNPAAADLLRLCAFLAPDAIPETIITEGASHLGPQLATIAADPYLLNQAIEALRAYSLLRREASSDTGSLFSVHRLVQAVLKDQMDEQSKPLWAERAVYAVNEAFPSVEHSYWPLCDQLLPHAQVCAELIELYQLSFLEAARLLNQTGFYLKERALYQEVEPLYLRALAIREQQLGAEHLYTAQSLNNLATLYSDQGKYAEAEPLLKRALAIREQQLGVEHPVTTVSMNNLGYLYRVQGKYAEAEPLLKRALAIREQQLGAEHPETATSLNNLATLYSGQGKYAEAELLYRRALSMREHLLGLEHPSIATSLNDLALLYKSQGKYTDAEPLYQQALSICEQLLGPENPHTQAVRKNYTSLLQDMARDARAAMLEAPEASSENE